MGSHTAVNLSPSSYDPAFGQGSDASVKAKIINLIASVRTLMRSTCQSKQAIPSNISLLTEMTYQVPLIVINTLIIVYELVLG